MTKNMGVPASPSGHSRAEPEEVSALRASVPNAAFTPGPWGICGNGDCSCKAVWCDDHPIAEVVHGAWGDDYPSLRLVNDETTPFAPRAEAYMERFAYGEIAEDTARANGRLIAAAPAMYFALQHARDLVCAHGGPSVIIDAALALAIDGDIEREAKMSALYKRTLERTASVAKPDAPEQSA